VRKLRLAFFVSGNGTLFETIATRCQSGDIDAEPALLISSSANAPALERAARLNVPHVALRSKDFPTPEAFEQAMLAALQQHGVNFVCLAGYLKLVPAVVVRDFHQRMLNIHPALLPAFGGAGMYGRHVHEAVLDYGARISGATVHLVDEAYDRGPIVLQRAVFVRPDDTPESLAARVHDIEHDLYAEAVRLFAQDRIHIENRHVHILEGQRV
jgi:formyltetrahydrofolate-dependent phosphoribosylglycinamide formyltransferase